MLRISKLTDYAILLLEQMARRPAATHAAAELAGGCGISVPTVSKILKLLAKSGVVTSTRGARGGYALARSPEETTVARIIDALEGPIALTECGVNLELCQQSASCGIRGHWNVINRALRTALESVTLADMVRPADKTADEASVPRHVLHYQPR